jgi:cis-3-alkyl-4-acyloxetan-2-one decarboxylase
MTTLAVGDVEVIVDGQGREAIVFVHGWPDTHRLWEPQVAALKDRYRCVRFTLPGFDMNRPARAYALDEVVDTLRHVVERACPGERVTLLLHDWGCFYGYQFATRHPQLVKRVIGVDVGDVGSRRNLAMMSLAQKLMVVGYQVWLAASWAIGGKLGDGLARWMAAQLGAPAPAAEIGARMGYPYAMQRFKVQGGFGPVRAFDPQVPMLFIYGERKRGFLFHSQAWLDRIAARPHSRVIGLPTGHWVMVQRPQEFNDAVRAWLGATDEVVA